MKRKWMCVILENTLTALLSTPEQFEHALDDVIRPKPAILIPPCLSGT